MAGSRTPATVVLVHGAWADGSSWLKVILAAHAYAGAVVGATDHERVRALVYVAALAPDDGESVADVFYRETPDPAAPELTPDRDGYIWLPDQAFATAFAPDASRAEQLVLAAIQRPIHVSCIQQPVRRPLWRALPSWYLVAENDRMINPVSQRFMAERMGAHTYFHIADHAPLVSNPGIVVNLITAAARSVLAIA